MNAFELFKADQSPAGIWACGECRLVYGDRTGGKDGAEACCRPYVCSGGCGREIARYRTTCDLCWREKQNREREARVAGAEKLAAWDGWVFWEGAGSQDGYFESLGEFVEWLEERDEGGPWPEWVFTCDEQPFQGLDYGDLIERLSEEEWDGFAESLDGTEALKKALAAFNEANRSLVSYLPNYRRVVRVPGPEATP